MLSLIRQYQDPTTRAAAWRELCTELTLVREVLPSRLWFRGDKSDRIRGAAQVQAGVDYLLAEMFDAFDGTRTTGLLPWIFGKIRNRFAPDVSFWKAGAVGDSAELNDELPIDTSRPIEAPDGSTREMELLWHGELDPFDWITKHRGGMVKELDYQILLRRSQGLTYAEIGQALSMSADAVEIRIRRARAAWLGK